MIFDKKVQVGNDQVFQVLQFTQLRNTWYGIVTHNEILSEVEMRYEPVREKNNNLHRRKQSRRSAVR